MKFRRYAAALGAAVLPLAFAVPLLRPKRP